MQQPDTRPGNYYVTVLRDNGDYRPLYGPFGDHQTALNAVNAVMRRAIELDPRASWYAFGTARLPDSFTRPGILNNHLEV